VFERERVKYKNIAQFDNIVQCLSLLYHFKFKATPIPIPIPIATAFLGLTLHQNTKYR
jgi:hypothetical protein